MADENTKNLALQYVTCSNSNLGTREITGSNGSSLAAKPVKSLFLRLKAEGKLGPQEVEDLRKELPGVRVLFYTDNDVSRFVNSGIMTELFEVDWERSKFHFPQHVEQEAALIKSHNFVVTLNEDRTNSVEFSRFKRLWCEARVQTVPNHTWAEMEHGVIYKRPELEEFGTSETENIKRRLDDVMTKHLMPEDYDFQRIDADISLFAGWESDV